MSFQSTKHPFSELSGASCELLLSKSSPAAMFVLSGVGAGGGSGGCGSGLNADLVTSRV